jgi:hypothetical protein
MFSLYTPAVSAQLKTFRSLRNCVTQQRVPGEKVDLNSNIIEKDKKQREVNGDYSNGGDVAMAKRCPVEQ